MIKLYKATESGVLYHEAWAADLTITEHWGRLGERGSTRDHALTEVDDCDEFLAMVLAPAREAGFSELEDEALRSLQIQYCIQGFGSSADLSKCQALEDRMNELLGWSGLGQCEGGKLGYGSLEVCCRVVDFGLARSVIEADLVGSVFADYRRIFETSPQLS